MLKSTLLSYPIPRRQTRCSQCQIPFKQGVPYYTLLYIQPSLQAGQRCDFCSLCGEDCCNQREEGHAIFWQGKTPIKIEEKSQPALAHHAVALLRELCISQENMAIEQAFLLALYLTRKQRLMQRYQESMEDGSMLLWYEVLSSGELIAVPKVVPQKLAAVDLQRLLTERLAV